MADKQNKSHGENKIKKPFDKKKWRENKYGNKQKVQRWQEKRKQILQRKLKKELEKDGISTDLPRNRTTKESQPSRLNQAQLQYNRQKEEEREKAEEARKIRQEKEKKIKEYRAKKAERLRKLSQKTSKGQPVMRGRLELLQQKIERMVAENKL